ncbi:hypothetical protein BaRGS_00001606 [Batillaria attramentaria]|uniref:Uncharacterized protein n=1 Tax=Batillaria attramentaria TaxID=370345 RepID=A0ABD0M886_9CAEN
MHDEKMHISVSCSSFVSVVTHNAGGPRLTARSLSLYACQYHWTGVWLPSWIVWASNQICARGWFQTILTARQILSHFLLTGRDLSTLALHRN